MTNKKTNALQEESAKQNARNDIKMHLTPFRANDEDKSFFADEATPYPQVRQSDALIKIQNENKSIIILIF